MSGGKDTHGRGEPVDFGKIMSAYRVTNTHHTEAVNCVPLPSLSLNYGARNSELRLHDESGAATLVGAPLDFNLVQQSGRIVELLRGTDIGYLCLREHSKVYSASVPENWSSLEELVLEIDSDAFSYAAPGPIIQKGLRISTAEIKETAHTGSRPTRNQAGSSPQWSQHADQDVQIAPVSRKKRMTRKRSTGIEEDTGTTRAEVPAGLDGVSCLCELLDELFHRSEAGGEDEVEEAGSYLILSEIKRLLEELVKLRAKNSLHTVPSDYLLKLLTLLDRHVRRAHDKEVDGHDDVDSVDTMLVFSALEAIHASLTVMTNPGMPKQVYKEEIIDSIIACTRYQIVHSVFRAYDPVYRHLHKGSVPDAEEDCEDLDEDKADQAMSFVRKPRRKGKLTRARRPGSAKVSSAACTVSHKLCSILALLKDLLSVERLPDSTVLQLTKSVLATFCVDNVQLLQLKAVGVACSVFCLYPGHRSVIIEECVSMFWKLSSSKRNIRTYLLPDEEPKQVQMLTALLLQLVQCSVRLPGLDAEVGTSTEASSAFSTNCLDPAMDTCKNFWKLVLQRWAAPKSQDSIDVKGAVENIVIDLLTTLNAPEFPAASLLLQILCILLFSTAGLKSKDSSVRGAAIELFGLIASRLKQDAISCSKDSLWILSEIHTPAGSSSQQVGDAHFRGQGCAVCQAGGKGTKIMVSCAQCERLFHRDCIGIGGNNLLGRDWLCCCCLCKKQLASFTGEGKPSSVGDRDCESLALGSFSTDGRAVLQQLLLNYLQEVARSDSLAAFARGFYLCQWYRDESQGLENLDFHRKRLTAKLPVEEFGVAWTACSRDVMTRLSAALGQQRPLAKGFDRILERLLTSLQENISGPRAKALRAVSALVEVDPTVLGDERVQIAVEGRFLDSAISVREAAMELVGRHIVRLPHVAEKYFDKLAERIMDTGVSVRKRVIKIIRDVCVANTGFARSTDACVKIISRINDEESSIQDLVGRTFYELWFEESAVQHSHFRGDGSLVPVEIATRTQQIVDVLKSLGTYHPIVIVIKRSLSLDFAPQAAKTLATIAGSQAAVRTRCELMCKCLLESILKAEESTSEEPETRALPYVLALHAFCTVDPTLCAPPSDPSCFVVTLQPYLKVQQVDTRVVAQLLQSIVFVVDAVLPMLRRPPQNLVDELEKDLRNLVNRNPFQTVIHACIKCVASLSKITGKGVIAYQTLVRRNFKALDTKLDSQVVGAEKANVLRSIYCLGMLSRYCPDVIDCMGNEGITMERVLHLLKHYLRSPEFDVKCRALQALGVFCIARPDFMLEKDTVKILEASLVTTAHQRLKLQTLRNFCDYLSHVEEQMGASDSGKEKVSRQGGEASTPVPVAAGAGDSSIAGGIIQLHWELILERCLDMNHHVRLSALKVLEIVVRQGLVHPMSCVPQLIALEVDEEESVSKLAHRLVMLMNEKYPSFFESRLGDGLHLSFNFIQSGAATSMQDACQKPLLLSKVKAKAGIARIYKLIKNNRTARNKFLGSILRKYDTATSGPSDPGRPGSPMTSFLVYCAEILASLPFSSPDEPLYVVFSINRIVQVRGGSLEANIKAIIAEEPLGSRATRILDAMAAERVQEGIDAYDYNTSSPRSQKKVEVRDEDAEIPEEALNKLKDDCQAAMALALLLQLKRHLKIVYGLTDARCQAFTPSESIKPGEVLQKKENIKEFSTKDVSLEAPTTVRHMLEQYQTFKRLLKEDSMDYSAYTVTVPKKRGRQTHADAANGANHGEGHPPPRAHRRKDAIIHAVNDCETDGDFEPDDDDDRDWSEKRRKSGVSRGKGRGRKSSVI